MEPSSDSGGRELSGIAVEAFDGRRCRGMAAVVCLSYVWKVGLVWSDLAEFGDNELLAGVCCAFTWMLDVEESDVGWVSSGRK
jgi:hypothetical protein